MLKTVMGVDLGSKNVGIALKEGCFSEPSLICVEAGKRGGVRSLGEQARFEEYGKVAPIRNGCCANVKLLARELIALTEKYGGKRGSPRSTELFLALAQTLPHQRLKAFEKAAETAGFHSVRILERSLMGALGAGVDIDSDKATLLVDIGAQTVNCAAICSGGILFECSENYGSELAERAIQNYFASAHRVRIGSRMAELMKMNLDRLGFTVDGRSIDDGLPRAVKADAEHVRAAALGGMKSVVSFAADMIRLLPPEACADLIDTGIILIGGGAKMAGIAEFFETELGLGTQVAENAETAVAEGMRLRMFLDKYGRGSMMNVNAQKQSGNGALIEIADA